jgi:hypothetical protein
MENLNVTSVQQSEVPRTDFIDVTNSADYNLSSTPNYTAPSVAHPDSASHNYLQESQQMQNISPLTSYMVCIFYFCGFNLCQYGANFHVQYSCTN